MLAPTAPGGRPLPADHHLLDHRRYPQARCCGSTTTWEIESAYLALRTRCSTGMCCVPGTGRAGTRGVGAADALPVAAHGMVDAVESRPAPTRPGQLHHRPASRSRQLVSAAGICPDSNTDADNVHALPMDRLGSSAVRAGHAAAGPPGRYSARKVKCATSRYLNRDDAAPQHRSRSRDRHPCAHPPLDLAPRPDMSRAASALPPPTRVSAHRVAHSDRSRGWSGADWRRNCRSRSTTCSPNSPNGPASGSSPAPAPAATRSTHAVDPRQPQRANSAHCCGAGCAVLNPGPLRAVKLTGNWLTFD